MTDANDTPETKEAPLGFLVSVAVCLGLLALMEVYYRASPVEPRLRKDGNHITAKAADYAEVGGDVVVTGDSRMFHGVVPHVMTQTLQEKKGQTFTVYNFGIPSGTTPTFLMVANEVVHHRPRPKVFVIGLNPASFSAGDQVAVPGLAAAVRWSAVPWLFDATWRDHAEEAGAVIAYGASRLLATRTELSAALSTMTLPTPPIHFQERGWNSMGGRVDPGTQDVRAKGRAGGYAELMDKSKGAKLKPMASRFLEVTLAMLKNAGIKPVVIAAPQARQLDWFHDSAHTYFEYVDEVKRITSKENVPFYDCNAPPGIESTDFVDGDHLSEPGAVIFTKYLASEIVAPQL